MLGFVWILVFLLAKVFFLKITQQSKFYFYAMPWFENKLWFLGHVYFIWWHACNRRDPWKHSICVHAIEYHFLVNICTIFTYILCFLCVCVCVCVCMCVWNDGFWLSDVRNLTRSKIPLCFKTVKFNTLHTMLHTCQGRQTGQIMPCCNISLFRLFHLS